MSSTTLIEENKRIARRYPEEVATGRNLDLIDELLAEGYVEHGPFGGETHGPEADREQMRAMLAAVPDFEAIVEDVVAEGDTVAMRVTLRGTHEGEMMGVEGTGKAFEIGNTVFTRIEDGKIVERWIQPDVLGFMQQVGAVDLPEA